MTAGTARTAGTAGRPRTWLKSLPSLQSYLPVTENTLIRRPFHRLSQMLDFRLARGVTHSMKHCPSCSSSRIRSGYRPAPIWLRAIGFRELLCDNCNYLYRAFSPLSPRHPRRPDHTRKVEPVAPAPPKAQPRVLDLPKSSNNPQPRSQHSMLHSAHVCPHCGSSDTQRRRRTFWERWRLMLSSRRPYFCNDCDRSFLQARRA